jgi:hypothetical protein
VSSIRPVYVVSCRRFACCPRDQVQRMREQKSRNPPTFPPAPVQPDGQRKVFKQTLRDFARFPPQILRDLKPAILEPRIPSNLVFSLARQHFRSRQHVSSRTDTSPRTTTPTSRYRVPSKQGYRAPRFSWSHFVCNLSRDCRSHYRDHLKLRLE